jgi:hypothetical protein
MSDKFLRVTERIPAHGATAYRAVLVPVREIQEITITVDDEVRLTTTHRSYMVKEPFEYFERALECIDTGALFHPSNEAEKNAPTGAGQDHRSSG